jgi:F-type H+-transporting ATPase subunit epsilon
VTIEEPGGAQTKIAVHGGFVEVSHNKVTILSDVAELAGDIDIARAQAAKEAAEAAYRAEPTDDNDAALRRAAPRVSLAA